MPILSTPNKLYKDVDFSFEAHPETGDVLKKIDNNAVKQSVTALINTAFGERPFNPDLGSSLRALLFEPIDYITSRTIQKSIEYTLGNFEPRIALDSVTVEPDEDANSYEVSIYFSVVGINQPTSMSITLERLR
jgi:phage baseplate assembly protein W